MKTVSETFYTTSEGLGHPVAIEPEGARLTSIGILLYSSCSKDGQLSNG